MTDIRSQNTAAGANSYFIFATDRQDALWALVARYRIGFKALEGTYMGATETSYIVNIKWFNTLAPALFGQDSVLVLGPVGRHGARPATLHYLDKRLPFSLGYFIEVGLRRPTVGDYTFDPTSGLYYQTVHNEPEGAMG
jgi:hypothetical protein